MIILYDGRWTTKLMNCNLLCNHVSDFVINERYEADFNSFIRHRRVMILLLLSSGLFIVYHQQIILILKYFWFLHHGTKYLIIKISKY